MKMEKGEVNAIPTWNPTWNTVPPPLRLRMKGTLRRCTSLRFNSFQVLGSPNNDARLISINQQKRFLGIMFSE
jgi:hypothetical protein